MGPFLWLNVVCVIIGELNFVAGLKVQATDHTALLNLRKGFQDPSALKSWDGMDCANLLGVKCTTTGQVSSLSLGYQSLGGALAPAICSLTSLTTIDMPQNQFLGGIPGCMGGLPSLTYLALNGNNFSGPLPRDLCRLKKLTYLDLSSNRFSGGISACFGDLLALANWGLDDNSLTGPLPKDLCRLKKLTYLHLSGNQLQGAIPGCLGGLAAMANLDLRGNGFTGLFPGGLCSMKKLTILDLSLNHLSGGIPSCLGDLPLLSYLGLNKNNFSGPILADLCRLKKLTYLNVAANRFLSGAAPGCLGSLLSLSVLALSGNKFSGPIPGELCRLKMLTYLDLSQNGLAGAVPGCLGDLPALSILFIGANRLSGSLPAGLCRLKKLEYLYADNNQLSGSVPSCLLALRSLKELYLYGNYFTGAVCPPYSSSNCFSAKCSKDQRSAKVCAAFCGATSAQGPCGGHGRCFLSGTQPTCACDPGYKSAQVAGVASCTHSSGPAPPPTKKSPPPPKRSPAPPPPGGGANRTRGLVPPSLGSPPKYLSKYFRHASYEFSGDASSANWNLMATVDWRQKNVLAGVKDQGSCSACWSFAAVGAIEAANAILISSQVAASEQQIIDCQRGSSSCAGGWPGDAFEYASANTPSYGGLVAEGEYLYQGAKSTFGCDVDQAKQGQFGVAFWEQVDFYGWFGLLLAVQRQPVVVNIQADQDSFLQYTGQGVYSDAGCFKSGVVDHSVLLVGYNLAASNPYWIIRNSWGPAWGDNGYMYLAIVGGDGICGISSTPGSYPVVKGNNPCGKIALNPCGGGTCFPKGASNECKCPPQFVAVTNLDGSQSCAPQNVCRFFLYNPCNVGTCVDDGRGAYACICPAGFYGGFRLDSSPTCVPAPQGTGTQTYVVQASESCYLIHTAFRLTLLQFLAQNKGLKCNALRAGTIVNVTPVKTNLGCTLLYSLNQGDTCASVKALFSLKVDLLSINPGLDCSLLVPGQQVCVRSSAKNLADLPLCTQLKPVEAWDTCPKLWAKYHLTPARFFELNPGIYCGNLVPKRGPSLPGQQVCVAAAPNGRPRCKKAYKLQRGDSCASIIYHKFKRSVALFRKLNRGLDCRSESLFVQQIICVQ